MKRIFPYIIFEASTAGNLNDRYCYAVRKRPEAHAQQLNSYKQAKHTLKRLFSLATVNHITITGGEPFLCESFAELALFCRMKKTRVSMITNGAATTEEYKLLLDLGVELFEFPLHAAGARIHNSLTGVARSWENSVRSIRELLSLGGRVAVVIVITRMNHQFTRETLEFLTHLGVRQVMLNRFDPNGRGLREQAALLPTHDELRQVYQQAHKIASKEHLVITSNVCAPFCVLDPREYPAIRFSSCAPQVVNLPLTLNSQGDMRLCNHSSVVAGNIFRDPIDDILTSEYVKDWQRIVPDDCQVCDRYPLCRGGCRAASEHMGFSLERTAPLLQPLRTRRNAKEEHNGS